MKRSIRKYGFENQLLRFVQFVFAVAAITSGTNALAKEPPFKYVLLPIEPCTMTLLPDDEELCLGPIKASVAGQNCANSGGKVVVEMRAGKRGAWCRTAASKRKPPPFGDGSPGPYDQGGGPETKTLPIKPSPISPSQASGVYCHAGSPPPCPPTAAVGSDVSQVRERLRATTKTQGDFNLAGRTYTGGRRTQPPGLPPPIVSESKTIKPPYSPTNPAPMDSKDPNRAAGPVGPCDKNFQGTVFDPTQCDQLQKFTIEDRRAHARDHLKRDPALTTSFWNAAVANNQAELKRLLVLLGFDQASLDRSPVTIQKDPKTAEPVGFTFATQTGPLNIALKGSGPPKNLDF